MISVQLFQAHGAWSDVYRGGRHVCTLYGCQFLPHLAAAAAGHVVAATSFIYEAPASENLREVTNPRSLTMQNANSFPTNDSMSCAIQVVVERQVCGATACRRPRYSDGARVTVGPSS